MDTPQISNLSVETINFVERAKEKNKSDAILKALSRLDDEAWVSFHIKNCDATVANLIRHVVLSEVETYCLDFDIEDVETDAPIIWGNIEGIRQRIRMIHISQTKDLDKIYTLKKRNDTQKDIYVKAEDFGCPYEKNMSIFFVQPGSYLNIKKIKVIKNIGLQDACFKVPIGFRYDTMDFINVDYVIDDKLIINSLVSIKDVDVDYVFNQKILVNPTDLKVERKYEHVINKKIQCYNSDEIEPRAYYMAFKFILTTDPKAHFERAFDAIIVKLEEALKMQFFLEESKTLVVTLPTHTKVYADLIAKTVFDIKLSSGNKLPENLSSRMTSLIGIGASITITDIDAKKLYKQAIEQKIKVFQDLKKQIILNYN